MRLVEIAAQVQLTARSLALNASIDTEESQALAFMVLKRQKTAQYFARGCIYVMFWCITIKLSRASDSFFAIRIANNNELHRYFALRWENPAQMHLIL
jgi:hypothetical protein